MRTAACLAFFECCQFAFSRCSAEQVDVVKLLCLSGGRFDRPGGQLEGKRQRPVCRKRRVDKECMGNVVGFQCSEYTANQDGMVVVQVTI